MSTATKKLLAKLETSLTGLAEKANTIDSRLDAMKRPATGARAIDNPAPTAPNRDWASGHAPAARSGSESSLSSRGFMFSKLAHAKGEQNPDIAKNEIAFCAGLTRKAIAAGYKTEHHTNSILIPIMPELLPTDLLSQEEFHEAKQYMTAGVQNGDIDQLKWHLGKANVVAPANPQSWVDQSAGGSFVPPPMFGTPIELLRNKAALLNAGATVVPLGPSGRMIFPRLTNATQAGWTGENVPQTPSQAGTGTLELSAKKVWGIVVLPGELIRFGSPSIEILIRNDLFQSVALVMDYGMLQGPGSSNVPLGIATQCSNTSLPGYVAASTTAYGVSGYGNALVNVVSNELTPQNVYDFTAAIKANNATPTTYIMRPEMAVGFRKARWTPYSSGTNAGGFTFDLTRKQGDPTVMELDGLPVVETVQVSNTRGTGAQTYIICMNGPDFLVGMFGAIEFTQSDVGWTLQSQDQVMIRALLSCDGGSRHPSSIAFADGLGYAVGP